MLPLKPHAHQPIDTFIDEDQIQSEPKPSFDVEISKRHDPSDPRSVTPNESKNPDQLSACGNVMENQYLHHSAVDDIITILNDAPLLADENRNDFDLVQHAVWTEFLPVTLHDKLLAMELVHTLWELRRYRRVRDSFINAQRRAALQTWLVSMFHDDKTYTKKMKSYGIDRHADARKIAQEWLKGRRRAVAVVENYLKNYHTPLSEIVAATMVDCMAATDGFDQTIRELLDRQEELIAVLLEQRQKRALRHSQ